MIIITNVGSNKSNKIQTFLINYISLNHNTEVLANTLTN